MKNTVFRTRKKKVSSFDPTRNDIDDAMEKFKAKGGEIQKEESNFSDRAGKYQSTSQTSMSDMLDY